MVDLRCVQAEPVVLESVELVLAEGGALVRVRSKDGAMGVAPANQHARSFKVVFEERVAAGAIGRDARDLPAIIDAAYRSHSSYKLGFAFWNAAAWFDQAVLDLLGRIDGVPVHRYFGGAKRTRLPVYLSSLRRESTPEQEVDWLQERLEATGASAIKLKIGGRMSLNVDAAPGRSEQLVALARRRLGDRVAIHVDANGSYDVPHAIEVGRMLQDHGVAWFEEPCPFEEYDWTREVADTLDLPVAGGEQDHSLPRFRWMIDHRGVDIVQPDVNYCGGLLRTVTIGRMVSAKGLAVAPHAPRTGPGLAATVQAVAVLDRVADHLEYRADASHSPQAGGLYVKDGCVEVPMTPGLGHGLG